jgi:hypothetical protein
VTEDELAEETARRKFGPHAVAVRVEKPMPNKIGWASVCFVSDHPCGAFCWLGFGATWGEAFADADRRLAEWRQPPVPPPEPIPSKRRARVDYGPLFANINQEATDGRRI